MKWHTYETISQTLTLSQGQIVWFLVANVTKKQYFRGGGDER